MSSRSCAAAVPARPGPALSPYGTTAARLQALRRLVRLGLTAATLAIAAIPAAAPATGRPLQVVAFGDSLSAGYMLPADAAFPAVLQTALRGAGFDVVVANAGVSGDTSAAGLERLDWSVPDGTDAVIVELGANDMLRGLDPAATEKNLGAILARLKARNVKVLLAGMLAAPGLGADYVKRFDAMYPELADRYGVPLYGFFLAGVAQDPKLKLIDGMHPNPAGVAVIVKNILPSVETLLRSVAPKS
jgi:acyl-CoA thioesterase-1